MSRCLIFLGCLLIGLTASGQSKFEITGPNSFKISQSAEYYIDTTDALSALDVVKKEFTVNEKEIINLDIVEHDVWVKVAVENLSETGRFTLTIDNANIDEVTFYEVSNGAIQNQQTNGDLVPYEESDRVWQDPFPVFNFDIEKDAEKLFLFKIKNREPLVVPIGMGTQESVLTKIRMRDLFFALYSGIMLVMLFYNFFIFFSLRNQIYLKYVLYILLVYLTQSIFQGYAFKYFWPNSPLFNNYASLVLPSLTVVTGLIFIYDFLNVRRITPRARILFVVFIGASGLAILLSLLSQFQLNFYIGQPAAALSAIFIVVLSVIHILKGNRQGFFLLIAWSAFFLGVILFILKNFSVIPSSFITNYGMTVGSAIETVLLSFALAARINTLKKQREESQRLMLMEVKKNNDLTRNQNLVLEEKVHQRTLELEVMNSDLQETLSNLKSTQGHLIEAEKMASLGHLTAGIAHEINNPINYVSSNVEPLRQDLGDILTILNDYKDIAQNGDNEELKKLLDKEKDMDLDYSIQEMKDLLNGIEEGAKRTSEIVTGLKNFSRTDEDEAQSADVNNGLRSTITILKSELKGIETTLDLGSVPHIKCYLGKLNQVFMNLIDNAIDAIKEKFPESDEGKLIVRSEHVDNKVVITIQDNGCGMPEEVSKNIFDPFYTTKDVGKGTGLGLSITYGIMEKHNGTISVDSTIGEGSTFTIELPITNQPEGE
ncbi:MAG: GHKL domain-containing protein [Bacteroidia bacterium]|nr:GHKL domain-containing protein [Bacteroidia bacterium]